MSLCLFQQQQVFLKQRLTFKQKLKLRDLLKLEQTLIHPEYPNMVKGLEGMQIADEFLKERSCSGLLIGGLASAVWNQRRTEQDLKSHKDVDVLVLDKSFNAEPFEKGIDWWMPREGLLEINFRHTNEERYFCWYKNFAGAVLGYNVQQDRNLEPGLYIPNQDFIANSHELEISSRIDYERVDVEIEEEVLDYFNKKIRGKLGKKIPKFVSEKFGNQILSKDYCNDLMTVDALSIGGIDLPTLAAISRFENNYQS